MENPYLYIVILLAILAIGDLIVGVSNDAVNFLNSAIGSKAISFKNIMILASLGIAIGAISSSGMMEVARKGIFNPAAFNFEEIIYIFTAVMITDILLLDVFNTLGMPTSTTVSIVFELLGAAVIMSIIKINLIDGSFSDLGDYINTSKASQIILGIILSVIIAFTIGSVVQWLSRVLLTFHIEQNTTLLKSIFGGFSLSALSYFIIIKGVKGSAFANQSLLMLDGKTISEFINYQPFFTFAVNFLFWLLVSTILIKLFRLNIFKIIIGVGTFALALAFAGNDLVNFIGVPIAAFQSYEAWSLSNIDPDLYNMEILNSKVATPTLFLLGSGIIMILTLWFSSKAKKVVQTSIDLANQHSTKEKFNPNFLSRILVKFFIKISYVFEKIIPTKTKNYIQSRFELKKENDAANWDDNLPSFDQMRASINLVVAAILISIATSLKLPLSTTYVTFMVAMGTSLSDKAWGRDSAVYRVSGVISVIGGWFLTAFCAFTVSGLIVYLFHLGGITAIVIIFTSVSFIIIRNYLFHKKEIKSKTKFLKSESKSREGVISEADKNITETIQGAHICYLAVIDALSENDEIQLKNASRKVKELESEIYDLRDNLFYYLKTIQSIEKELSLFYVNSLRLIQDIIEDISYIVRIAQNHINNQHNKIQEPQINDLKDIENQILKILQSTIDAFEKNSLKELSSVLENKNSLILFLEEKISNQILITRSTETSAKNATLYFNILLKSKDLIEHKLELIEDFYKNAIKFRSGS